MQEGGITRDCFESQLNGRCEYMLLAVFLLNPHLSISLFYRTLNLMNYQLHSFSNVLHSHNFEICFCQMLFSSHHVDSQKICPSFIPHLVFTLKMLVFCKRELYKYFQSNFTEISVLTR